MERHVVKPSTRADEPKLPGIPTRTAASRDKPSPAAASVIGQRSPPYRADPARRSHAHSASKPSSPSKARPGKARRRGRQSRRLEVEAPTGRPPAEPQRSRDDPNREEPRG